MITIKLHGARATISALVAYRENMKRRTEELSQRLAAMGAIRVSVLFSQAIYKGPNQYDISVERVGKGVYKITASGESVAFVEFGAGVTYGYGHPQAEKFGVGPGTYPGQTHAMTGKGWWIPKDKGGGHTYGNPPNMPMYNTAKDLRAEIARVAMEVFST